MKHKLYLIAAALSTKRAYQIEIGVAKLALEFCQI